MTRRLNYRPECGGAARWRWLGGREVVRMKAAGRWLGRRPVLVVRAVQGLAVVGTEGLARAQGWGRVDRDLLY